MRTHLPLMIAAFMGLSLAPVQSWATDTNDFVQKAAIGNMFEIESSKLAIQQALRSDVKEFAQTMIDDHSKADAGLKSRLSTNSEGVKDPVPATLDDDHNDKMSDLREAKQGEFDKQYIDMQVDAHEDAVGLFKDYSQDGENPTLKQFATETLPALEQHQVKIKAIKDVEVEN